MESPLYTALYKLIEQRYISDEKRQVGKRLTRVYYHLEEAGKQHLEQLMADYFTVRNGIDRIINLSVGESDDEQ